LLYYRAAAYIYIFVFTKADISFASRITSHLKSYFSKSSFNKYDI